MAFKGSSSITSNLIYSGSNFVTGPTGPTGPVGATGSSITGPTGNNGPYFSQGSITEGSLGITYIDFTGGETSFFVAVTGPSGGSVRITDINFVVSQTGGEDSISLFAGPDADDIYKFYFKTIKIVGEATGGISGNAFFIESPGTTNSSIGITGSLFYVNTSNKITPTNDTKTNYYRSEIVPNIASDFGVTLDTFTFNIGQNLDLDTAFDTKVNLNWIKVSDSTSIATVLNNNNVKTSEFWSGNYNRTDQGTFITVEDEDGNLYPKVSFRAEGITLALTSSKQYDAFESNIIGKGITYSQLTYKDYVLGSCCYCTTDDPTNSIVNKNCIDYTTKTFCDSISGNFSFITCNDRYISGDCYSGGACCVNGVCIETNSDLCSKVYGKFYPNIKCNQLEDGCPTGCVANASCCIDGICYSLPTEDASEELCNELNGTYDSTKSCEERNCCIEGFLGACCYGPDNCKDEITPLECKTTGGVYQGPGTVCSSSDCCKDSTDAAFMLRSTNYINSNQEEIPKDIKIGDYFGGGIVAGFVGYPIAIGFEQDMSIAKGEIISEIENYEINSVKRYVAVNGVFNPNLKCNCSNFSPSRYINLTNLNLAKGKVPFIDVKSLSGVNDEYRLTFYNRLTDACLTSENKPCNDNGIEYKKYGYNSVVAYRQLCNKIHGETTPSAWLLIVAPEDFNNSSNVSFGMSVSVNGFNIPNEFNNYKEQLWQNNILTPYGTTVFDGLLNTRMFDYTSIERNNWFIPNQFTVNGMIENLDPLAYYRFKHTKFNYWQSNINETLISRNASYFKEKYKEMWEATNTSNTALYQISENNINSYNGYSDWYIPSALELNIIYHNLNKINSGLINQSSVNTQLINPANNYWSSTTGGRLLSKNRSTNMRVYDDANQAFENISVTSDNSMDAWKNYKMAQAHRAYTQNMGTGKMISALKSISSAKLRACRMIPIYFKNDDVNQFEFSFRNLNTCSSCR